jgi:hypothetical protein
LVLMSRLRELELINNGEVDATNSTSSTLGASATFTGDWVDTLNFGVIVIGLKADQASATDGLKVEWSADGATVTQDDVFSIPANAGKVYTFTPANQYYRIRYVNGSVAQTSFVLQSVLKKIGFKPSSHRLMDAVIGDDDAELTKSVITAADLNGNYSSIGQFKGALDVHQADVHHFSVNKHFIRETGTSTTISTASNAGDTALIVADTTGFLVGDTVTIRNGGNEEPNGAIITAIAAGAPGTLTMDRPMDYGYGIGSTVKQVIEDMASLAGTLASPVFYKIAPPPGEIWHILRILLDSTFGTAADDSRFGNITGGITNGMVIRQNLSAGFFTFSNWKKNGDMKRDMYDLDYTDRAGGGSGQYGMSGRLTFKKVDVVFELDGDEGDSLEILVQDDITSLNSFEVHAQGHVVGR